MHAVAAIPVVLEAQVFVVRCDAEITEPRFVPLKHIRGQMDELKRLFLVMGVGGGAGGKGVGQRSGQCVIHFLPALVFYLEFKKGPRNA